jgi:N-acyl-D-amino-acid deacylase
LRLLLFLSAILLLAGCANPARKNIYATPPYDVLIRGGTVYDGLGNPGVKADVGITGDRVTKIGTIPVRDAKKIIDARGKAVAPGFINMLSWATESLLVDGRAMSDLKQGVTLQVFGEGWSMGPLNDTMKADMKPRQRDVTFNISWTSLGQYLETLEKRGISPNVASFVGAATVRMHELGSDNRAPTADELARMQELVRQSMREGALGVGSSLIYAPGTFASTEELIALAQASAPYGGRYISHMRSESDNIERALDELLRISREGGVPAEIYHLKIAGKPNWPRYASVIAKIEAARASGLDISTNMYTYTAGATGLDAAMPTWVQEGGVEKWIERLKNPAIRARVLKEMREAPKGWESLYRSAGSPKNLLLVDFGNPKLKYLTGKTLDEVARLRKTSAEDTIIDLVIEDGTRVGTVYFLMSEDNVKKQIKLPYMAFGSDEASPATEDPFLRSNPHPRAYGNVARLLGRYVREQKLLSLPEAIHKLSGLPARRLNLKDRGTLTVGAYADVVVFDPATIADKATYAKPHHYAVGVSHVIVNGIQLLRDGNHTGATAGRVVRGPGWTGWGAGAKGSTDHAKHP